MQVSCKHLHPASNFALSPELQALVESQPLWRLGAALSDGIAIGRCDHEALASCHVPKENKTIGTFGEL